MVPCFRSAHLACSPLSHFPHRCLQALGSNLSQLTHSGCWRILLTSPPRYSWNCWLDWSTSQWLEVSHPLCLLARVHWFVTLVKKFPLWCCRWWNYQCTSKALLCLLVSLERLKAAQLCWIIPKGFGWGPNLILLAMLFSLPLPDLLCLYWWWTLTLLRLCSLLRLTLPSTR